jgi:uncharacterized membrane protein YqhA
MIHKLLISNRYFILIAVAGAFLASVLVAIYSACLLVAIIIELVKHPTLSVGTGRLLTLECIELIDIFLLSTAFYIVATGLYKLFINPEARMLSCLQVESLEELKARLLGVIIVVLSVFFLEQVITWDGKSNILDLGIAEALVIGVLALTIKIQAPARKSISQEEGSEV